MHRRLCTVLLWLLFVALPLQGWTATTRAGCGSHGAAALGLMPSEHADGAEDAPAASDDGDRQTADDAGGATAAVDAGLHADTSADAAAAAPAPHAGAAHAPHAAHKTSACAACCSGAALPSPGAVVAPSLVLTDRFAPVEPIAVADFLGDGIERPPRVFLG